MALSAENVNKIAWLARILIDENDIGRYAMDISGILDFVEQLSAVDTSEVVPMAHPLDHVQPLRPDRVTEKDHRDYFQLQAPKVEAGLYLVPKVIE